MQKKLAPIILLSLFFLSINCFGQKTNEEELQKREAQLDSLLQLKQTPERDSLVTMNLLISIMRSFPLTDSTLELKSKQYQEFTEQSVYKQTPSYYKYLMGNLTSRLGYYNVAINYLNGALEEFQKFGNEYMMHYCYNELSAILSLTILNNPEKDKTTRSKFYNFTQNELARSRESDDSLLVSNYYLNIALQHLVEKDYPSARIYYRKLWQAVSLEPERYWYSYHNGRWAEGLCLIHMGQTKKGFRLINETIAACEIGKGSDKLNLRVIICYLLGDYYIGNQQYDLALAEAKKGVEINKVLNYAFIEHFLNKNFYQIYKAKGQHGEALDYYEKIVAFNEKLEDAETKGQYMLWANEQENIQKDNRIKALEVENLTQVTERQNIIRNTLIAGLLLAGLLTLYIFRSNRQLKEVNASLVQKNKEIETALFRGQHLERKRVASELHDTLATKVSALKWRMEAIEENFADENRGFIQNAIQSLEELYTDVRFISHNLLPEELERKGLKTALATLVEKLNRLNKTKFHLVFDGLDNSLEQTIQYEFYNVVLELCNNVLKHAQASEAYISISEINERLFLTVTDNGVGINAQKKAKGVGQANIRNRIESLGGEIEVNSSDTGTKITVAV